jgi:hypothetical protein
MTALDIIILICGTWYVSFVVTRLDGPGKLFLSLRSKSVLGGVTECIYCLSFWVAVGLYALLYYQVTELVYVLGITGAAHILAAYTGANYGNGGE